MFGIKVGGAAAKLVVATIVLNLNNHGKMLMPYAP